MNYLESKILTDGVLKAGNILKVNSFLNHLIDVEIIDQMSSDFIRRFKGEPVTKVLTIEASGIAIAMLTAFKLRVPLLFAKKTQSLNVDGEIYAADAYSFTHKTMNHVFVSRQYLSPDDRVLIIDDFVADGQALRALTNIVEQAGAKVVGCGIAIEKGFQKGGDLVRGLGYRVESVAIIEEMDYATQTIKFREQ